MNLGRALRYAPRYRNWRELTRIRDSGGKPRTALLRNGIRFDAPPGTNIVRAVNGVFFKQYYSPRGFEIREGDVVIDIGAHVGAFSVYAGRRTRGPVLAIEPHPENARYLRQNLSANGCTHVRILECAIADTEGTVRLYTGNSSTTHHLCGRSDPEQTEECTEVPSLTLRTLMEQQGLGQIHLLKMDCEGAEGLILSSTGAGDLRRIQKIAMEFHDDISKCSHEELRALLRDSGFTTRLRWDGSSPNGLLYASRQAVSPT